MGADGTVPDSPPSPRLVYPVARRDESFVEDYHGVKVPDPYRWLEQEPDSPEVAAFVKAQVELTEKVFAPTHKESQRLRRLIMDTANHPRYRHVWRKAGKWFYFHNTGLQPQDVVYCCDDEEAVGRHGEGETRAWVLVDPNGFSKDGTAALHGPPSVSEDGKYAACLYSPTGGDWCKIRVVRVDGGGDEEERLVDDSISWVKFTSICWTNDSKGFFYVRWQAPNLKREGGVLSAGQEVDLTVNAMVCYHFLGTDQSEDLLCWDDPAHRSHYLEVELTQDGRYLLVYTKAGAGPCKMKYCDLSVLPEGGLEGWKKKQKSADNSGDEKGPLLPFVNLIDNFEARHTYVANDGPVFVLKTNKDAPMMKLVRVDLRAPDVWETLVEESDKSVMEAAHAVMDKVLIKYVQDAKSILQVRDLSSGKLLHQVPLEIGNVSWIMNSRYDPEAFIGFVSFLTPGTIYRCNLAAPAETLELKVFREIQIPGLDSNSCEVKQVFAPSKDGTKVPMFIMSPKDIVLDGSNPVLMHGYGGYSMTPGPTFSVSRMILAKHLGVVYCSTNLRGGGEYGEEWHKAGSKGNKQNVFDDFIACAEYMVSLGYTSPGKICIEGASNGGLLIGATVNQRPDLYGCAFALGGPMDMLRYHKFTIGHYWVSEYGCSEKEEDFNWLIKYSPLHTVKRPWEQDSLPQPCQYPATMMFTADHDDRVVPLHSLKQIATLQHVLCTSLENSPQTNPIFCRILMNTGHGAGASTQKQIDEAALRYAFMAKQLGITWRD